MNKTVDHSNLGYLGSDAQYKIVKTFIEEPKFYESTNAIVIPHAFTEPLLQRTVQLVKDYYDEWSTVPTYATLETLFRSKAKSDIDIEEAVAVLKKIKATDPSGIEIVKDITHKFFAQQAWLKLANEIRDDIARNGVESYDKIKTKIDALGQVGCEEEYGHDIFELKDKALSNDYTVSIPTGISKLDDTLGGGLDKGKLGLIIAPAGFGKTSLTTAICSHAATYRCESNNYEGYKVLQIYFEDDDVDVTRKHYSRLLQQEARSFKRLSNEERTRISGWLENVEDKDMLKNNLRLKHFKTGQVSASDIELFIRRLINTGFKPDLVSIDYFECLSGEKGGYSTDSEWTREGVTMRKLENMAHELDIALWVPTQGTKDSINSPDVVRMDQAGGSIKKIHVAQLIISIARSLEDVNQSLATLAVLKNRSGKSGEIFKNIKFNNGTSTISCDEVTVYDNALTYQDVVDKEDTANMNNLAKACLGRSQGSVSGEGIQPSTEF